MEKRRLAVRGIIIKNNKLFAQTFRTPDGSETEYWATPGGGLDIGEPLHDGLRRELIEETGIVPRIGRLLFVQQFQTGTCEQLEFFFHIENPEDYENVDLTTTTHGMEEIARFGFVDPATTHLLPAFLRTMELSSAITDGPVFIHNELK